MTVSPTRIAHPMKPDALDRFERVMLPLMDDAYTLARYLTGDEHDAQDVVQEAYLRALRYFDGFEGVDARAWLLTIVRNTSRTWLRRNRGPASLAETFDETRHEAPVVTDARVHRDAEREELALALDTLGAEYRETLVLRDVEGMAYKQIAHVLGVPIGTVMSRLARARRRLRTVLEKTL